MKLIINDYDSFYDGSIILFCLDKTLILNRPQADAWLIEHHCWNRDLHMIDYNKINYKKLPMFDEIIIVQNGSAWFVEHE